MPVVSKSEMARRDLVDHYVYLTENASPEIAERFLSNAEASFNDLAQQPLMGAPLKLKHYDLGPIRKWRVKGFDNQLVFYLARPDGIAVLRVLHAARDWWRLLGHISNQAGISNA